MRYLAGLSLVVALIGSIIFGYQYYERSRDIEAVAHRAQVAADADDMLNYMETLKTNMEVHGMTKGYAALIFKQPSNDLELLYGSINRIINRLQQVREMPKTEVAYQVALDDLRGTIRELEAPSMGVVWAKYWFLLLLWIWPLVHVLRFDFFEEY